FSSVWLPTPLEQGRDICPWMLGGGAAVGGGAMVASPTTGIAYCGANFTKVTTVDVSNMAHPVAVDELYLPGSLDDGRMIQNSVRLVLGEEFLWPQGLQWYPQNPPSDSGAFAAAVDQLEAADEAIIRATPLASWLPVGKHKRP